MYPLNIFGDTWRKRGILERLGVSRLIHLAELGNMFGFRDLLPARSGLRLIRGSVGSSAKVDGQEAIHERPLSQRERSFIEALRTLATRPEAVL